MTINIRVSPQYQGMVELAGDPQNPTNNNEGVEVFDSITDIPASFDGLAKVGCLALSGDGSRLIGLNSVNVVYLDSSYTTSQIIAKVTTLAAAGGGVIHLSAGIYNIDQSLPLVSSITYTGDGYKVLTGSISRLDTAFGTIIKPTGAFPAFAGNDIEEKYGAGINPTINQVYTDSLFNASVKNLGISGGTYGIKLGGYRTPGTFYSKFYNIFCELQTKWGFWFENCGYVNYEDLYICTLSNATGIEGALMLMASVGTAFNYGNSHIKRVFAQVAGTKYKRGICIYARNNSALNDVRGFGLQTNAPGSIINYTSVTGSASGPDLVLQPGNDWDQLKVGFPIHFQSGFATPYKSYFIVYADSETNTIRVSTEVGGTAVNTATSATLALRQYGPACIEIVAEPGSTIQPYTMDALDTEGPASMLVLCQNADGNLNLGTVSKVQGTTQASSLCVRGSSHGCVGTWSSADDVQVDFSTAGNGFISSGAIIKDNGGTTGVIDQSPKGLIYSRALGGFGVNLGGSNSILVSEYGQYISGGGIRYPALADGIKHQNSASTALSLTGAHVGCITYTGAGAATWTLPILTNATAGTQGAYQGAEYQIVNASGSAITLNTQSSQLFNKVAAKTSISIPAGAAITIVGAYDGTTPFWAWTANNGAT